VTALEQKLYMALLGARTVVSATANINPSVNRILKLVDSALGAYTHLKATETPPLEETADAP
jgi:hypothetical protein